MQFVFYKNGQKYTISNATFDNDILVEDAIHHLNMHNVHISAEQAEEELDDDPFEPHDGIGWKKEIIN